MSRPYDDFRAACRDTIRNAPSVPALVLGSGMGPVIEHVQPLASIGFGEVPGLVPPTVAGHGGRIVLGRFAGRIVLVFTGRLHFYEGHPWSLVVRTIETAKDLDAGCLILTNASGGIADRLVPGSLMVLERHWEWNRPFPGLSWGTAREPASDEATSPYSPAIREALREAGRRAGVELAQGVYLAVTGPTYETPAEVRAMRSIGVDAVGMSTTRESARAAELGMPAGAISCVANRAAGLSQEPLTHHDVLQAVRQAATRLAAILEAAMTTLPAA